MMMKLNGSNYTLQKKQGIPTIKGHILQLFVTDLLSPPDKVLEDGNVNSKFAF